MNHIVLETLHHDGKVFAPGDLVELTEEQGAALTALGVVKPAPAEKPKK